MSETDDIFDIDHFLEKAPTHIKIAWSRHLKYFKACEQAAEKGSEIMQALRTIKTALEGISRA